MEFHDFGWALNQLRAGKKVYREGWNGRGMWLIFVPGTPITQMKEGSAYSNAGLLSCSINPHIDMMTAQGTMQPGWLASQTDMLAEDWEVING